MAMRTTHASHAGPADAVSNASKSTSSTAKSRGVKPVGAPRSTRIKDTELVPVEEPSYVDNYLTTRRFRHPFQSLDRNFRLFDWRTIDKTHTYGAIIALCLHIGTDPPDIIKPEVCAKMEAWVDPFAEPSANAISRIAQNLQKQYEFLLQTLRFKLLMDPTIEDTKRYTVGMRRQAKGGRILFHYNGHGVPKPTRNGDIWVFNKHYSQYIPVSVQDIQIWLGSPGIFVYDCSAAGNILEAFVRHARRKDVEWIAAVSAQEERDVLGGDPVEELSEPRASPSPSARSASAGRASSSAQPGISSLPHSHSIHFAACRGDEQLPMSPTLPADVFTACMTTPVEMAMRWWIMRNGHLTQFNQRAVTMVPGMVNSRRTPLGEINWIFTAITDTIAWNTLTQEAFKKLFRHDMLISTLFRNFMFASRLMRYYNCHPMSYPKIPDVHDHPLWEAFEHALDDCLTQLPNFYAASENQVHYVYVPSGFFALQLDSFENYLTHGAPQHAHAELLPIILQVLLSQLHRNRALRLLAEFLMFGRWAVNQCLAVGIFPYILKLINSSQLNTRGYLAAIWAAIISVDYSVRLDLLRNNAAAYFIELLMEDPLTLAEGTPISILACRVHCLMVLTHLCRDLPEAQSLCGSSDALLRHIKHLLEHGSITPLRQWSCLFVAELCKNHPDNIRQCIQLDLHESLSTLLESPVPEVRAAAAAALGTFFGPSVKTEHMVNVELIICLALVGAAQDASPMVRKEIVIGLSWYVQRYGERFFTIAMEMVQRQQVEAHLAANLGSSQGALDAGGSTAGSKRHLLNSFTRASSRKAAPSASHATGSRVHSASQPLWNQAALVASLDLGHTLAQVVAQRVANEPSTPHPAADPSTTADQGSPDSASAGNAATYDIPNDTTTNGYGSAVPPDASSTDSLGVDMIPHDTGLAIWRTLLRLSVDPVAEVAQLASFIVDYVVHPLLATLSAVTLSDPSAAPEDGDSLLYGSVSPTQANGTPRQRSVSHHATLTSPTRMSVQATGTTTTPSEGARAGGPGLSRQNSMDVAALEALTSTASKYGTHPSNANALGRTDSTTGPSPWMTAAGQTMRTTPPTPTRHRTGEPPSMASKLTSSLKRSASSTLNLMYNLTTGSTSSLPLSTSGDNGTQPAPPMTPTAAQMRSHFGSGPSLMGDSPPSGGADFYTMPQSRSMSRAGGRANVGGSHRHSAIYSHEDPALRHLHLMSSGSDSGPATGSHTSLSRWSSLAGLSHPTSAGSHLPLLPAHMSTDMLLGALANAPRFDPPVQLPLVSKFLEWQSLLGTEPYLRKPEEQQEGSRRYLTSAWRKARNDGVIARFESQRARYNTKSQWSKAHTMSIDHVPASMLFHRYQRQLVVTDGLQTVSVYNWETQTRQHQIQISTLLNGAVPYDITAPLGVHSTQPTTSGATTPLGHPAGANATGSYFFPSTNAAASPVPILANPVGLTPTAPRITTMQIINEMDHAILMVGTHDGTLRFFQHYADPEQCEMVTGWQDFTEHVADRRRCPAYIVTDWVQYTGQLLVTGSTNTINVWDLAKEYCVSRITSRANGVVHAVTADQHEGHVFFCGGADGIVRVYDQRLDSARCQVQALGDGDSARGAIVQTVLQCGYNRDLFSAGTDGRVKVWDLRTNSVARSLVAHSSGVLNQLVVHDNLPIFATAASSTGASGHASVVTNGGGASHASASTAAQALAHHANGIGAYSSSSSSSSALPYGGPAGSGTPRPEVASNHSVKVWNTRFDHLGLVRHYTGLLSQRVATVTGLAMDHFTSTLAMGNDDSTVTFLQPVLTQPH
ncbi:Target of rapamycin complex 1 subunit kog1 [Dimargaris xerosporica]|nr:Target of rapamycin complex 1 subunit kog1 [Dimargaris xerosporica]